MKHEYFQLAKHVSIIEYHYGEFPSGPVVKNMPCSGVDAGLNLDQEIKIPWCSQKKKKERSEYHQIVFKQKDK